MLLPKFTVIHSENFIYKLTGTNTMKIDTEHGKMKKFGSDEYRD